MKRRSAAPMLLALFLCGSAAGAETHLVRDINPLSVEASSDPQDFIPLGGAALFKATDESGLELWRSDGTAAGTFQVIDACPGECSGSPGYFAITDRMVFFLATSDDKGSRGLWVTGGSPGDTFLLTAEGVQIELTPPAWVPQQRTLYFVADDGVHGKELWRTDGTPAGTHLVTDLRPGAASFVLRQLTAFNGQVVFVVDDGTKGPALWKSDGTTRGTVRIKDKWNVVVDSSGGFLGGSSMYAVGSSLLAVVYTTASGSELWRTDGTARGTVLVTELVPGSGSPQWYQRVLIRGRLYLYVKIGSQFPRLWVTDGTKAGTQLLTNFQNPGGYVMPLPSASLGNRYLFGASDGVHGLEPWITDGTRAGTRMLRDVCPGACSAANDNVSFSRVFAHAGRLYFMASDGTRGMEPWITDGTRAGTRMVRDICPGPCGSQPGNYTALGSRVLFIANDGQNGHELWITGGTVPTTTRISDFEDSTAFGHGAAVPGAFLFRADGFGFGRELWRTDGTLQGTGPLRNIFTGGTGDSFPSDFYMAGGQAFFFADDGVHGKELWKSDGTEGGTVFVHEFVPGNEGSPFPYASGPSAEARGMLFFNPSLGGSNLWRTDGTDAGTIPLTPDGVQIEDLRAVGDTIFFATQTELWKTDGTVEGTELVTEIGSGYPARQLTSFGGRLYFCTRSSSGRELWTSDGTAAGTRMVKDILPGSSGSEPFIKAEHAGFLWFYADDGEHGFRLWRTDGTPEGTQMADLGPGLESPESLFSAGSWMLVSTSAGLWASDGTSAGTRKIHDRSGVAIAAVGGKLYFHTGNDPVLHELWITDGSEEGTRAVLDRDGHVVPWRNVVAAVLGNRLYFAYSNPGVPFWQTDGTPAGTYKIQDLNRRSPNAQPFARAGDRLLFQGFDPATGHELWAFHPD